MREIDMLLSPPTHPQDHPRNVPLNATFACAVFMLVLVTLARFVIAQCLTPLRNLPTHPPFGHAWQPDW